jgi:hypothetical protein
MALAPRPRDWPQQAKNDPGPAILVGERAAWYQLLLDRARFGSAYDPTWSAIVFEPANLNRVAFGGHLAFLCEGTEWHHIDRTGDRARNVIFESCGDERVRQVLGAIVGSTKIANLVVDFTDKRARRFALEAHRLFGASIREIYPPSDFGSEPRWVRNETLFVPGATSLVGVTTPLGDLCARPSAMARRTLSDGPDPLAPK